MVTTILFHQNGVNVGLYRYLICEILCVNAHQGLVLPALIWPWLSERSSQGVGIPETVRSAVEKAPTEEDIHFHMIRQ